MNLLVIGMNYAPEPTGIAPYTTELCEFLSLRGHRVTVATTFPHYPEWKTHRAYAGRWMLTEMRSGVTVKRKAVFLPGRAATWQRILYDTSLGLGALLSGLRGGKFDLVLGIAPPVQAGVTARLLSGLMRVPYVLWIQDLALEAAMSVGMMHDSTALRAARRLEKWTYARASKLIVISRGFVENLRSKGVLESAISYLPGWVDTHFMGATPNGNGFRRAHALRDDAFVVLHSGNMGAKQHLQNVLSAAAQLRPQSEIAFVLVGDGSQKKDLMAQAQREHLDNVHFLPLVPRVELPHLMASADLLLLNQHPDVIEAVIPSKLLTYMAAARPVLVAAHPDSEASRQVRAAKCGVWVAANQPKALANAVVGLARDERMRNLLGQRGRAFVTRNFARDTLLHAHERELLTVLN